MSVQKFGGSHTVKKLDLVERYLNAYVTVMKNRSFITHYVDAFAGSGSSTVKTDKNNDPLLFEIDDIVKGSVPRALEVEPAFDRYIFIDKKNANILALEKIKLEHKHKDRIYVRFGDANDKLLKFAAYLETNDSSRAVVFLDPFGLSVKWETIVALADTEKVDLWYLVPVHGMSRQITDKGQFLPSAGKIDLLWGSQEWRKNAVLDVKGPTDLLGTTDIHTEKIARAEQFSVMFREHLKTVFKGGVASNYLRLGKGNLHEFSLMFACANPSRKAFGAALRIANHLLKGT